MMDIVDLLIIHVMLHLVYFRFDIFYLFDTCKEFKSIYLKCRWTGNGCTMLTDVQKNSLMDCIIFCLWLRQTSRMVLCAARVFIAIITRITHLQESYTATFSQMVSWRSMFVGRSTENRGLPWKTMKKKILTTTFPGMLESVHSMTIFPWKSPK